MYLRRVSTGEVACLTHDGSDREVLTQSQYTSSVLGLTQAQGRGCALDPLDPHGNACAWHSTQTQPLAQCKLSDEQPETRPQPQAHACQVSTQVCAKNLGQIS